MLPKPISDTSKLPSFRVFITYASRFDASASIALLPGPPTGPVLIGSAATGDPRPSIIQETAAV